MSPDHEHVGTALLPLRGDPAWPAHRSRHRRARAARQRLAAGGILLALAVAVALLAARGSPAHHQVPLAAPALASDGQLGAVVLDQWALRRDPRDVGLRRGWATGHFAGRMVTVPLVANPHPITGAAGARNFRGSVAWYRTRFSVPHRGYYAVRFESVNHLATVWLDGRRLGSHTGTYLPFELHFSARAGPHVLVLRADWRNPVAQVLHGFHRTWFNFGGINRPVTVRAVGPSGLANPDLHTRLARGPDGSVQAIVDVSVVVHNYARPRTIAVQGTLTHGDQRIALRFAPRALGHRSSATMHAAVTISHPALWAPGHPGLYELSLSVPNETGYQALVGLRQLTWSGRRLFLNGRPLVIYGASLQEDVLGRGDALTSTDQDRLVNGLRAIGANATRSQHPLDTSLLAKLDAAGILVWQGVGPVDPAGDWTSRTPALMRQAERRVRTTVHQEQLHPSVIAWNLVNEVGNNGHPGGEKRYVHDMVSLLHTQDPGRLVAVDIWGEHAPRRAGPLYDGVDAIGDTNYLGWYEGTLAPEARIAARIRGRLRALRRTFPDKVLIVSEFGAEANRSNPYAQPGGYGFQARLLALHLRTYRDISDLSGMLVWDLRDFAVSPSFAGGSIRHTVPGIRLVKGINQKGLYSYGGVPKPALAVVRRAFDALRSAQP